MALRLGELPVQFKSTIEQPSSTNHCFLCGIQLIDANQRYSFKTGQKLLFGGFPLLELLSIVLGEKVTTNTAAVDVCRVCCDLVSETDVALMQFTRLRTKIFSIFRDNKLPKLTYQILPPNLNINNILTNVDKNKFKSAISLDDLAKTRPRRRGKLLSTKTAPNNCTGDGKVVTSAGNLTTSTIATTGSSLLPTHKKCGRPRKPFSCGICKLRFLNQESLATHVSKNHEHNVGDTNSKYTIISNYANMDNYPSWNHSKNTSYLPSILHNSLRTISVNTSSSKMLSLNSSLDTKQPYVSNNSHSLEDISLQTSIQAVKDESNVSANDQVTIYLSSSTLASTPPEELEIKDESITYSSLPSSSLVPSSFIQKLSNVVTTNISSLIPSSKMDEEDSNTQQSHTVGGGSTSPQHFLPHVACTSPTAVTGTSDVTYVTVSGENVSNNSRDADTQGLISNIITSLSSKTGGSVRKIQPRPQTIKQTQADGSVVFIMGPASGSLVPSLIKVTPGFSKESSKSSVECDVCGAVFKNQRSKLMHRNSAHGGSRICRKNVDHYPKRQKILRKVQWKCASCSATFSTKHILIQHQKSLQDCKQRSSSARNYMCVPCQESFKFKHEYIKHCELHLSCRQIKHKEKFSCKLCSLELGSKKSLKIHLTRVHRESPESTVKYLCPFCGYSGFSADGLSQHMEDEHPGDNSKTFQPCLVRCDVCHKQLRAVSLRMHKLRQHSDFKHACHHCPLKFRIISERVKHENVSHNKEKPYRCALCPAIAFPSDDLLR